MRSLIKQAALISVANSRFKNFCFFKVKSRHGWQKFKHPLRCFRCLVFGPGLGVEEKGAESRARGRRKDMSPLVALIATSALPVSLLSRPPAA